jgi:ABC-type bacteriocin/lantibiotic exporter with double-glycine peptidase domain
MGFLKEVIFRFKFFILIKILIICLIFPIISFFEPLLNKYLFDYGIMAGDFKKFVILLSLITIFSFISLLLEYIIQIYDGFLKNKIREYVIEAFVEKFYELPYSEVIKKDKGYYISRIYEEPTSAIINSLDLFINILSYALNTIARFIAMLILSPIAAITALPLIIISYFLSKKFQPSIHELTQKQLEYEALLRNQIGNFISSYIFVNTNKTHNVVKNQLSEILKNFLSTIYNLIKKQSNFSYVSQSASVIVQIAFIIINAYLLFIKRITFGDFVGFLNAFYPFYANIRVLFESIPQLFSSISQLQRIEAFKNQKFEPKHIIFSDIIELKDIEFSYDGYKVFQNFSLRIKRGEKVLIFGANGTGKTTLLYIISGFLEPQKGTIRTIKDISISTINLIDMPIKEYLNINVFQKEKLLNMLNELNLDLNKKPSELSTGQLKKLSVALALSKPADVYLLDEPLESVDIEDKRKLIEMILNETKQKTLLLTTHDLIINEYINFFDKIIELKKEEVKI